VEGGEEEGEPAATATAAGGGAMAAVRVVVERDPRETSFSFSFFSVLLLPLLRLPSLSPSLRRAATAAQELDEPPPLPSASASCSDFATAAETITVSGKLLLLQQLSCEVGYARVTDSHSLSSQSTRDDRRALP
jgi:hypothetical protein